MALAPAVCLRAKKVKEQTMRVLKTRKSVGVLAVIGVTLVGVALAASAAESSADRGSGTDPIQKPSQASESGLLDTTADGNHGLAPPPPVAHPARCCEDSVGGCFVIIGWEACPPWTTEVDCPCGGSGS